MITLRLFVAASQGSNFYQNVASENSECSERFYSGSQRNISDGSDKLLENIYSQVHVSGGNQVAPGLNSTDWNKLDLVILSDRVDNEDMPSVVCRVALSKRSPKILVLSESPNFAKARHLFSFGIKAYVDREASAATISEAVQRIMAGKSYVEPPFLIGYLENPDSDKDTIASASGKPLSEREVELVKYLMKGFKTGEISRLLNKKATTISTQKSRIYHKLNVSNIVELLAYVTGNSHSTGVTRQIFNI